MDGGRLKGGRLIEVLLYCKPGGGGGGGGHVSP